MMDKSRRGQTRDATFELGDFGPADAGRVARDIDPRLRGLHGLIAARNIAPQFGDEILLAAEQPRQSIFG